MRISMAPLLLALIMCWGIRAADAQSPPMMNVAWDLVGWSRYPDQPAFGCAVAGADFNGDGYSDVAIGARLFDISSIPWPPPPPSGQVDEGRVYVYYGSACGLPPTIGWHGADTAPSWTAEGDQNGANLGTAVANAGDVNNDGYDDLIVGATKHDNGQVDEGRSFLYLGSPSGLVAFPAWAAEGDQASAEFGQVAGAGDVNGDGYGDVIVGAPLYDNGQSDEGRVFLYLGTASGLSASPAWTGESDQAGAQMGSSVAGAGDVNGDGYDDVVVGARLFGNGQGAEGRACLYLGSSTGLSATPAWTAESDQISAWFGASVTSAGDVNGDGYSDVIIGAPFYDNGEINEGRVYVYQGSPSGLAASPSWTSESNKAHAQFGYSAAGVGDIDGDSISDVVVGEWNYPAKVYFFLGTPAGLSGTADWSGGGRYGSAPAIAVAGAGDVDGDGRDDVVVGSNWPYPTLGNVFLYVHASAVGSVAGVVRADGSPLPNATVNISGQSELSGQSWWNWTMTDSNGRYEFAAVPAGGPYSLYMVIPLGYRGVSPDGGWATVTVCPGQNTFDFTLEALPNAGAVRGVGYWTHQVNVYYHWRGNAQESWDDMTWQYPYRIYTNFNNHIPNPIRVEGMTEEPGDPYWVLEQYRSILNADFGQTGHGRKWAQAARQFLAVLLNVVSNRLRTGDVVSNDGGTASQAIQHIAALLNDADDENDDLAMDIGEAMNEGRLISSGVVDLTRPTIYYAHAMPSAPVVDKVRVAPNPMVRSSTLDFELATAGRAAVRVFDVAGRVVRTLLDGDLSSGRHTAVWDGASDSGKQVANGVYFYRIETPGGPLTARFVVMR